MPACCASQDCCCQWPQPHGMSLLTQASTGDSKTLTGKSCSVSCGTTAPFSWVLVHTRFCFCPLRVSVSPVLWKFCNQISLIFKVSFPGDSQSLCQIPKLGSLLWGLELSQECQNFFGVIALQFVDRPPGSPIVGLMATSSKRTSGTNRIKQLWKYLGDAMV